MKLGKLVDQPVTAAEAAKLGGIDFAVSKRKAYFADADGSAREVTDRFFIVRDDTDQPLGIVAKSYTVLQYAEAFDFMDTVTAEATADGARYVAAGALRGGRQGFMVVRAPESAQVKLKIDDPHELFFVLRTSHDRTRGCEIMIMPLRGLCMNQLTLQSFSKGVPHRWSVHHTTTMPAKLAEAQAAIQRLGAYTQRYAELVDRLAVIKLSEDQARQVLERVEPTRAKTADKIDSILHLWNEAATVGFAGTGWGLVNAVSEYYDWGRGGGSAESRFVAALEGQTYKAVNRTAGLLLSRN